MYTHYMLQNQEINDALQSILFVATSSGLQVNISIELQLMDPRKKSYIVTVS